jgi:hypothetical protein
MVSPGRRTRSTGVDIVWANPADGGIAKRPTQSAAAVIFRVICPPPSFNWSIRILYFNLSVSQGARSSTTSRHHFFTLVTAFDNGENGSVPWRLLLIRSGHSVFVAFAEKSARATRAEVVSSICAVI